MRINLNNQRLALHSLQLLSLALGCFIALLPLVVILFAAFKTSSEIASTPLFAPPASFLNFTNFKEAFVRGKMMEGFLNTVFILGISVAGSVITGSMTAFVLSRYDFKFNRVITFLFLLAALVPAVTTQVATFQVVNFLGLFNTRWAAIILFTGTDIISIYIFLQFLSSIPRDLDEAAILDGASPLQVYWRVILPAMKPAIITVIIVKGVALYNEFYVPFLYMPKASLGVISTTLFRFRGPFQSEWEVISAGIIIVIIPTLIAFVALQKYIYNGMAGAVK